MIDIEKTLNKLEKAQNELRSITRKRDWRVDKIDYDYRYKIGLKMKQIQILISTVKSIKDFTIGNTPEIENLRAKFNLTTYEDLVLKYDERINSNTNDTYIQKTRDFYNSRKLNTTEPEKK